MPGDVYVVDATVSAPRLRSSRPVALHPVLGVPVLAWLLDAAAAMSPAEVIVVLPEHGAAWDEAIAHAAGAAGATASITRVLTGTGCAAQAVSAWLDEADIAPEARIVTCPASIAHLAPATLAALADAASTSTSGWAALTITAEGPSSYDELVRDDDGTIESIAAAPVSAADDDDRAHELLSGVCAFQAPVAHAALRRLHDSGHPHRCGFGQVPHALLDLGVVPAAVDAPGFEARNIRDRWQLATVERFLRRARNEDLARAGVGFQDLDHTYVDRDARIEPGATVEVGASVRGRSVVAAGALVGAGSRVVDAVVGAGAQVIASKVVGVTIEPGAVVGPYAVVP